MGYVALLAFFVIAGDFFNTLLSSFFFAPVVTYSVIFAVIISLAALRVVKIVEHLELFFVCVFLVIMCLIVISGARAVTISNLSGFTRANLGIPYGVLLFAFGGVLAVPIQRQILRGQEQRLRPAIGVAVLFTALLYAIF